MNRSLLHHLREHTEALHTQLDQHPVMSAMTQPDITQDQYRLVLETLYRPQKTLEVNLVSVLSLFFEHYRYRYRHHFIAKDLEKLEVLIPDQKIDTLNLASASDALGILYVLKGSKLGAKQIVRYLEDKTLPMSFFYSAIEEKNSGWKRFTRLTELEYIQPDEVVSAARAGFSCFLRSLNNTSNRRKAGA